ncbi:MAG TPA: DUF6520 family protein [Flavobacterium sp.]|nr:DUF6520 family protein [Flavobacterium sp.]
MKTFVKMILPVAAFALASAGAVTTGNSGTKTAGTAVQGWKRIAPDNHCEQSIMCNNLPGPVCTSGGVQLYAKVGLDCFQVLTHKVN